MSNTVNNHQNIFTVSVQELEERLDPEFYKPEYFVILNKPVTWGKIKDISVSIHHPPEYERVYSENGLQLIRSQNVRPTGLSLSEKPVFFSDEFLEKKKIVFPKKGDVLIVRSGVNAGDVAVIEYDIDNAIIGADNLLVKPDVGVVMPKFIQVYFFTDFGRKLLNRYLTGATNKHISPYYMAKVDFPLIDWECQQSCIGIFEKGLLRKQQKEAEAKKLLASIDDYLLKELGITLPEKDDSLENRIFTTSLSKVSGGRFDPDYNSKIDFIENSIWKYPKTELKELITCSPQYGANEEAKIGDKKQDVRYIRITDIDEYGNLKSNGWKTAKNISSRYLLNFNDILFARSGSVGRCYIHKEIEIKAIFAGYLIRFVLNENKINPDYFFYFCHSSIYKLWVSAIERPAVQSNINSEEYKSLKVACPPIDKQTEIANHISNIRAKAKLLEQEGKKILEKVKQEVEKIILGVK